MLQEFLQEEFKVQN